jgi:hypothetical protein
MYCFHEKWMQLHRSRVRHLALGGKVKGELLLAIALAPQMGTTHAAPGRTFATCLDASLQGGGVCSASTLSIKSLLAFAQCHTLLHVEGLNKVAWVKDSLSMGDGRRTYDLAALRVGDYIALGASRTATAVMDVTWSQVHLLRSGEGAASRAADCFRGHACRATQVIVAFGLESEDGARDVPALVE